MSGLAAILQLDGRPADPALLDRMTAALAHRGPDGEGRWLDGPVGLGHRLLATTPEALGEKQPVSDEAGERRLAWDGRLDNRDELIATLGVGGSDLARATDPELVLAAYRRWGPGAFRRLVGDFALALWDGTTRTLFCARDVFGVKPLYYHRDPTRLLVASETGALFTVPGVPRHPDEAMIADYLLMGVRDPGRTFFAGVEQVPPAHVLRLDAGGPRLERYWDADPSRELAYAREDDYLDEFRELFRLAVRRRLRAAAPVGVLLSGGLDSTLAAATAEAVRRDEVPGSELTAFTLLTEGFLEEEWDAVEGLRSAYGTDVRTIASPPGRNFQELFLDSSEPPDHQGIPLVPALVGPVAARGCRVLLTGVGADELSRRAEVGFIEDLLAAARLTEFVRHVRARTLAYADGSWPREAAEFVWSSLPARLRRAVKRAAGRQPPPWLERGFARRAGLNAWALPEPAPRFESRCAEASYRALTRPDLAAALANLDAAAAGSAIECRHPYLDRPLVEFFLAVPARVKLGQGYRKRFVQDALASITPGPPRTVEHQTMRVPLDAAEIARSDDRRLAGSLFHPRARVFRYVDRTAAERMRAACVARGERYDTRLWSFLALETWLQRAFPDWEAGR